ncbi:PP2C family protein-serine/threonine phosphatase [Kitasatospora sp. NPDC059571]|uniref:PP2C family protein-serine/threonine phosphatase n=1 Tax=Kitasatospora sp. NPDC059571 TaxID=3346871 RepID=UPI0036C5D47E
MTNLLAVEHALRTASPHDLLDRLRDALAAQYGVRSAELLLADYSLSVLHPVSPGPGAADPVPARTTPVGRAFGAQEPVVDDRDPVALHLPVTVRGDRLGVLSLRLPDGPPTAELTADLLAVAEMLAHAIVVAERDTDVYVQARRSARLTLAAEMQWQLLPARSCRRPEYEIGAHLEPAYAIRGDNFDWSGNRDTLTLTVTNGMGEGIDASLLTNLAINALRNARRAGVGIADQAALADQAVYAQYQGRMHVSVLLLEFGLATGRVQVVDAGSPRLLRMRAGAVELIPFEAQLPLGMADETPYTTQEIQVEPGDRLIFVSDGVHEVVSALGEPYGEKALSRSILATRLLPAAEVPRALLGELERYRAQDPDDDALVICVDWHGRAALPQEEAPAP